MTVPEEGYVRNEGTKKGIYGKIFEHTLSQYGSYSFTITDNEYILGKTTYSMYKILKKFKTLDDLVGYIINNHWYEKKRNK